MRGFTLVEMLVVLLVMGIFLGMISVKLRPGERDVLRVEAERLAQVLDLAADEARIGARSIAWTGDAYGYRFWRLDGANEWSEIRDSGPLRARDLPRGLSISELRGEAMGPQKIMRVEFTPDGATFAFAIHLSFGNERYMVAASPVGVVRVWPEQGVAYGAPAPH